MKTARRIIAAVIAVFWLLNCAFVCNEWYALYSGMDRVWSLLAAIAFYTAFWWLVVYMGIAQLWRDEK